MNKINIASSMSDLFHKTKNQTMKHSPEILVVTGVVGVVASTVLACKATTKASGIIEKHKDELSKIQECVEDDVLAERYSDTDRKKDLTITYTHTCLDFIKLYAPSFILGTFSIICILSSNNILHKRNAAIAAAYESVYAGYKKYRKGVIDKYGQEVDDELRFGVQKKEIEETVVDEKGKTKTVKKTVNVVDPNTYSEYARFFDDGCLGWSKTPEYNLMYLKTQQNYANDKLKHEGILFLNDVYAMLGIPKTKAGQVVGWVYDESNPSLDNFVDFGIYDKEDKQKRMFVNGEERVILLDFNVDGNVWQHMK